MTLDRRTACRWMRASVLLVLVAGLGGCSSSTDSDSDPLIGDWAWVRSTGGIAGLTLTPASEGYTVVLRFSSDGRAEWWRDGVLTQGTTYQATRQASSGAETWAVTYAVPLSGFAAQTATFPSASELVLTDPCCDGFVFEFERSGAP